ncbi:hypothetical protein VIGAN_02229400 [Vigna angularis var. angularis]|uniref:Uncharacterized protein n=1 Tax=Vigna angularis var. angularis TaxID=157739 RepID=A0A0S3RFD7_PHAAN|nr:hypothetical protein VIGAN_02229400 [Vigna angularis var. angularis]
MPMHGQTFVFSCIGRSNMNLSLPLTPISLKISSFLSFFTNLILANESNLSRTPALVNHSILLSCPGTLAWQSSSVALPCKCKKSPLSITDLSLLLPTP